MLFFFPFSLLDLVFVSFHVIIGYRHRSIITSLLSEVVSRATRQNTHTQTTTNSLPQSLLLIDNFFDSPRFCLTLINLVAKGRTAKQKTPRNAYCKPSPDRNLEWCAMVSLFVNGDKRKRKIIVSQNNNPIMKKRLGGKSKDKKKREVEKAMSYCRMLCFLFEVQGG